MPDVLSLCLFILVCTTYADLFPTTVTERFWQSLLRIGLLAKIDRWARTAIVVKDYLYIIGGEQYDPNFEVGYIFGRSRRV